jgi:hypothetical protein
MEARKNPTASNGITTRYIRAGVLSYTGTREALIAAGHALAEWFPSAERPWKCMRRIPLADGSLVRMFARGRDGFEVLRYPPAGEWRQALAVDRAKEAIAKLPKNIAEYRARHADRFMQAAWLGAGEIEHPMGGFSFDAETQQRINRALADALLAIREGSVVYSAEARRAEEASIRGEVLPAVDSTFERFMASVVAPPKGD